MFKIAVLVSGSGSNLQAIINAINIGYLHCSIEIVISDRVDVYAIERSKKQGINAIILDKKTYGDRLSYAILEVLKDKVDLIVLAGYISILQGDILETFKNRIINIHPALIPSFCGNSMYGIKVHEKAIEYGVKVSGCTVHFVDCGTDSGPIILQRTVPVYSEDTPESLQNRVLEEEHKAIVEAIKLISEEKIDIRNRQIFLKK